VVYDSKKGWAMQHVVTDQEQSDRRRTIDLIAGLGSRKAGSCRRESRPYMSYAGSQRGENSWGCGEVTEMS
jgi:hypothetical protein